MGFQAPTTLRIAFDEGPFAGAEFVCSLSITVEKALMYSGGASKMMEDAVGLDELMGSFVTDGIRGWNLEDETGTPLPINEETFLAQATGLRWAVFMHWIDQVCDIPSPLGSKSKIETASRLKREVDELMASIPMTTVSPGESLGN